MRNPTRWVRVSWVLLTIRGEFVTWGISGNNSKFVLCHDSDSQILIPIWTRISNHQYPFLRGTSVPDGDTSPCPVM